LLLGIEICKAGQKDIPRHITSVLIPAFWVAPTK
jgi:hypothetical protein